MDRRITTIYLLIVSIYTALFTTVGTDLLTRSTLLTGASVAHAETESMITFGPVTLPLSSEGDVTLTLQEVRLPSILDVNSPFILSTTWEGNGGFMNEYWEIVYQLHSSDGQLVQEFVSISELQAAVGEGPVTLEDLFELRGDVTAGDYTLSLVIRNPYDALSLFSGSAGASRDGSYPLGPVSVYSTTAATIVNTASFKVYLPSLFTNAESTSGGSTLGQSRGYLTTPEELQTIKQKADKGIQPYANNVRELLNHSTLSSSSYWISQSSISGSPLCSDGSQKDSSGNTLPKSPAYLIDGSALVYAKTLVANIRTGSTAESFARNARSRILELVDTTNWGGSEYSADNQCILYLSWYIPGFVMAADLLETFPEIWTTTDKRRFQSWLAKEIYPKVAWSSRVRTTNNWGAAGSYASAVIADYLWDSGLTLREVSPVSRSLSPGTAYREHTSLQLARLNTAVSSADEDDGRCLPLKGIQSHGGIPDELRRAAISNPLSMCTAKYLPSISGGYAKAYDYQMVHIERLVAHAELALRRGDRRLYDNVASDNSGSILRAIKFIIQNPVNSSASYDWDDNQKSVLYVAYRYYRDSAIKARLHSNALRSGQTISYGRLTHGFAEGESLTEVLTVTPPTP